MTTLTILFIAFIVSYLLTPLCMMLAVRYRILDIPDHRKIHKAATPLLGGLAIFAATTAGLLYVVRDPAFLVPLFLGTTAIVVMGIVDDARKLSATFRLTIQVIIAFVLIEMGVRVSFIPKSLGVWKDVIETAVSLVWIVGVTNAYNYLDGLNGLATGSAIINLFCFAVILYKSAQYSLFVFVIALMGACVGFLPYNMIKRAKIFLGDAGSTFIGFSLASISLMGNWAGDSIVKISIPILILGVPIFDMIFTTITRIKDGKIASLVDWLRYSGKDHFHHCLVDLGLPPFNAVIFIYFVTLALGLSAIMVSNDRSTEAFLTLSQASIIFAIIATLIIVGKRRRDGWGDGGSV